MLQVADKAGKVLAKISKYKRHRFEQIPQLGVDRIRRVRFSSITVFQIFRL